jgi:enoyl-CoA hydratase/carnithine racemase
MDAPPATPDLLVTFDGAIAEVRLNRPAARNALSQSLMRQLTEVARHLGRRADVQAVILAGGDAFFSAGADLADPDRATTARATRLERRPWRWPATSASPATAPICGCRKSRSA